MRSYVDHVLALLPFEPEAYRRLHGPPCSYVGHPLIEQIGMLRPNMDEQKRRNEEPPVLLVLPGSRRGEIRHHIAVFGETLSLMRARGVSFEPILPTMEHLRHAVEDGVKDWDIKPRIVVGEKEKRAAYRIAHAALVKSGTSTLELALAGVPMVAAYKVGAVEAWIARRVIQTGTVILANLVIGENVVPEFIQESCTAPTLASALQEVLRDSELRRRQMDAFPRLDSIMSTGDQSPSVRAADIVLATLRKSRQLN
jgi:lipid-A-disaccharide synthase